MLVSMLHHVEDPAAAIAEAERILRPGGRLVLMGWTYEDLERRRGWATTGRAPAPGWPSRILRSPSVLALLPGARRIEIVYRDLEDGSLAALAAYPEKLVDPRWHRQTSYFERLERDHPEELKRRSRAPTRATSRPAGAAPPRARRRAGREKPPS